MSSVSSAPVPAVRRAAARRTSLAASSQVGYARPSTPLAPPRVGDGPLGFPREAWVVAALVAGAFAAYYWPNLVRLFLKTNPYNGTAEWAHALFVPIVSVYYVFLNRDELLAQPVRPMLGGDFRDVNRRWLPAGVCVGVGLFVAHVLPALLPNALREDYFGALLATGGAFLWQLGVLAAVFGWGVGSLLFGLWVTIYGIWVRPHDFVKDIGMVVTLFGAVLTLCGWKVMRIAWFPILFLLVALPWPGLFYSKVAMPLQQAAAHVAVVVMNVCGLDAWAVGTKIVYFVFDDQGRPLNPPRELGVEEACAGLKSLMTFVFVAASVAFLIERPMWQRLVITLSAVPIAIACNIARVSGQGLLDAYVSRSWSEGFAHQFAGLVMLIPGFFLVLGVVWLLDHLFVEVADDGGEEPKPAATA